MQVTIIGMGLIGTSLGLALRLRDEVDAPLGKTVVVGYDRNSRTAADARGRLAIDRVASTLAEAVATAQVVGIQEMVRTFCGSSLMQSGTLANRLG